MATAEPRDIRNVAVVGHRGAGKTALVEAMLFQSDATTRLGSVQNGTTIADWDEDEHGRQMSLSGAICNAGWEGRKLNLLDTPGDAGFVADSIADLVEHGIVGEEYWITSGDRALSLQQLVDVCVEHVPRLTGRSIDRPRMCEPDMFERLFLPVFLPALPSALREPLVQAMGFVKYLTIEKALPSSLPHLEKTLATGALPDPAVTLQANLAFWAARRDWVS